MAGILDPVLDEITDSSPVIFPVEVDHRLGCWSRSRKKIEDDLRSVRLGRAGCRPGNQVPDQSRWLWKVKVPVSGNGLQLFRAIGGGDLVVE